MKTLMTFLFASIFTLGLAGCDDGKAENTGEKIDEAVQDAGNAVEDACEDVTDENC